MSRSSAAFFWGGGGIIDPGAPNDRMFPNTPEVSQMVFSVLWKPVWLIWISVRIS